MMNVRIIHFHKLVIKLCTLATRKVLISQVKRLMLAITVVATLPVLLTSCFDQKGGVSTDVTVPFAADIVFYSDREGRDNIYILRTENNKIIQLTEGTSDNFFPSWSPDGSHVAFLSDRDGDLDLYVADVNTHNVRNLSNNDFDDWGPFSWSPDSTRLVFAPYDNDPDSEIYIVDAGDGKLTSLTDNKISDGHPVWSPDGKRIAYVSGLQGGDGLMIMELQTGQTTQLLADERWIIDLDWSPDGDWIVFEASRQDGTPRIDVIKVDGSERYESICGDLAAGNAVWSTQGDWIAFVGGPVDSGLSQLFIVEKNGSNLANLVENGAINRPSWSPDDRWIAFTGVSSKIDRRLGDLDIYVVAVDSGQIINLTQSKGNDKDPDWLIQR